jgi:hypothetical protein
MQAPTATAQSAMAACVTRSFASNDRLPLSLFFGVRCWPDVDKHPPAEHLSLYHQIDWKPDIAPERTKG